MMFVIVAVVVCLVLAAFHFLFTRLLSVQSAIAASPNILEEPFSAERYSVMDRLLDQADDEFLKSHSGYTRRMRKNFRKARISIFRGYLKLLCEDFNRTCRTIKLCAIGADADGSELAIFMLKEQFRFARTMLSVEFKLALFAVGWKGVDASALVTSLNAMRDRLQVLSAIAEPTAA